MRSASGHFDGNVRSNVRNHGRMESSFKGVQDLKHLLKPIRSLYHPQSESDREPLDVALGRGLHDMKSG